MTHPMLSRAQALADEMVRLRRDIHSHPELAFQETRTAALVAETLREIGGYSIRTGVGKTGVVADLGGPGGPTVAIRADMDALPILEANEVGYRSQTPGNMHACGHDAHTAMLLGAAHLLKERVAAEGLGGRVRLLFQPAEEAADAEGISGAPRMIDDGALDGVDQVIALHVTSMDPAGTVIIPAGRFCAAVDTFRATISASGGHGAYPHEGSDPLWMLIPALTALHGIVARRIDPLQPAVLSLGKVAGGSVSNVIPGQVYLEGTLRSFDPEVRKQLLAEVERALSIVRPLGGDFQLNIEHGYPAGWNDPGVAGALAGVGRDLLGAGQVDDRPEPIGMGAEDFAYMCQRAPGAMFMLGAATPDGVQRAHHTDIFDIDERVLPMGAAILAEAALRFLRAER
jgi:amidohydrolase